LTSAGQKRSNLLNGLFQGYLKLEIAKAMKRLLIVYMKKYLQQSTSTLIDHNFIQNLNDLIRHKGSSGGILNNQNYKLLTRAASLLRVLLLNVGYKLS